MPTPAFIGPHAKAAGVPADASSGSNVHAIGGLKRMRHIGLVARFSIVGLTVGMLVAGTMAWFIETQLTDLLLTNVAARASDQVERLGLTGYITAADFTAPYTAERLASISTRLDPVFANLHDEESGVIRLQMFASDGTILYSDVVALRGEKVDLSAEDHIVAALQGRVEQEVSDLDGPENSALKANFDSALEVYVPVDLGGEVRVYTRSTRTWRPSTPSDPSCGARS